MSSECHLVTLFASPQMRVSYCASCELFHVDMGLITLRLSESEFMHWSEGMAYAQARFVGTHTNTRSHLTLM